MDFLSSFTKKKQETSVDNYVIQKTILSNLQIDNDFELSKPNVLIEDKYSQTLSNLNLSDLEITLQNTLRLLKADTSSLLEKKTKFERCLVDLKQTLSEDIKEHRRNQTKVIISGLSNQTINPIPEEILNQVNKNVELQIMSLETKKELESIKENLRQYENYPTSIEEANEKIKKLEEELKILEIKEKSMAKQVFNDSI